MLLSGPVLRRDILIMIAVLIVAWFVKVLAIFIYVTYSRRRRDAAAALEAANNPATAPKVARTPPDVIAALPVMTYSYIPVNDTYSSSSSSSKGGNEGGSGGGSGDEGISSDVVISIPDCNALVCNHAGHTKQQQQQQQQGGEAGRQGVVAGPVVWRRSTDLPTSHQHVLLQQALQQQQQHPIAEEGDQQQQQQQQQQRKHRKCLSLDFIGFTGLQALDSTLRRGPQQQQQQQQADAAAAAAADVPTARPGAFTEPQGPTQGSSEGEGDTCVICFSEYEKSDLVKRLPCGHFYHVNCIDSWLEQGTTCPLCCRPVWEVEEEKQEGEVGAEAGGDREAQGQQHQDGDMVVLVVGEAEPALGQPAAAAAAAAVDSRPAATAAAREAGSSSHVVVVLPAAGVRE